jgi:hypothetical protein
MSNFRASAQARNRSRLHNVRRMDCKYAIVLDARVRCQFLEWHLSRKGEDFGIREDRGQSAKNLKVTWGAANSFDFEESSTSHPRKG